MGGLVRALQSFQDLGINVGRIESRPSQNGDNQADFLVDFECDPHKVSIYIYFLYLITYSFWKTKLELSH